MLLATSWSKKGEYMSNISLPKLKAILLYFGNNTKYLGKVKLMKLFYFLDFVHAKKYGAPVTYDTYIHLEHGPIPSTILNLIDTAVDDPAKSALNDVIHFESIKRQQGGKKMIKMIPNREFGEADKKYFSVSELEVLKEVCEKFYSNNADSIEKASHAEAPWKETNLMDTIPYSLAAKDEDSEVTKEEIELLLKVI